MDQYNKYLPGTIIVSGYELSNPCQFGLVEEGDWPNKSGHVYCRWAKTMDDLIAQKWVQDGTPLWIDPSQIKQVLSLECAECGSLVIEIDYLCPKCRNLAL